jgi:chemotaxis protein MotB
MSVLDGGKQTEVSIERIQQATPIETTTETSPEVNRIEAVIAEINEILEAQGGQAVTLEEAEDGFIIQMPASLLFRPGSAVIENDDALLFIKRVALMITKMSNDMDVIVRGHTDNLPLPSDSLYKDNWDLSTARAVSVVKELINAAVRPLRLSAAGHAEYRPITTNATPEGRARNRRVELHFLSKNQGLQTQTATSILDTVKE